MFIAISLAMMASKFLAFDAIVAFVERTLSRDHVITEADKLLLTHYWYAAAAVTLFFGGLLSACAIDKLRGALVQWLSRDALAHLGTPRPMSVLLWSSLCGLALLLLYLMHMKLGLRMHLLFKKEGLLENLTFILYLLSAVACAIAALRTHRNPAVDRHRMVAMFYLVCAVAFVLVAGEEVSWGQRVLDIKTPEALAALNYQQETNVHNLLTKSMLDKMTKAVALVFMSGLIIMWVLAGMLRMPVLHFLIPQPCLAGIALITFFSGMVLHLEIFEVLLAIFITYYSYRVYKAAVHRPSGDAALSALQP
ncbi:MAG: hypothetical protein KKA36_08645 [Gammaproteobacteria bacterium]|nr:hypothetical protein [Gammaproteobacteria bacterium]